MERRRLASAAAALGLLLAFVGCSGDDRSATAGRDDVPVWSDYPPPGFDEDAYYAECPEDSEFHRNLDFVRGERSSSPEEAAKSVVDDETQVVSVRRSGLTAEVDVTARDESGVFFVEKRGDGWLVEGGEGCAAWPAARALLG